MKPVSYILAASILVIITACAAGPSVQETEGDTPHAGDVKAAEETPALASTLQSVHSLQPDPPVPVAWHADPPPPPGEQEPVVVPAPQKPDATPAAFGPGHPYGAPELRTAGLRASGAHAGANDPLQRDIRIMETVLGELVAGSEWGSRSRNVSSTYLPGYGVIFHLDSRGPVFRATGDEDQPEHQEQIEALREQIYRFFEDYAASMRELPANEQVMVYFNERSPQPRSFEVRDGRVTVREGRQDGTGIQSLAARMEDIQEFRRGDISRSAFRSRLTETAPETDNELRRDARMMAGILETGLKDEPFDELLNISTPVNFITLPGHGLLFTVQMRPPPPEPSSVQTLRSFFDGDTREHLERELQRLRRELRRLTGSEEEAEAQAEEMLEDLESEIDAAEEAEASEEERDPARELAEAFEAFENRLKELMVDYGRTLRSLPDDQHLVISVQVTRAVDPLPGLMLLRASAGDLQAFDRQEISQQQIMDRIQTDRYE